MIVHIDCIRLLVGQQLLGVLPYLFEIFDALSILKENYVYEHKEWHQCANRPHPTVG